MKKMTIAFGFALLLLLGTIIFQWWHDDGIFYPYDSVSVFPESGIHKINSEEILLELEDGNTDVFEQAPGLEIDTSTIIPLKPGSYTWKQADYLLIANAYHQFIWGEPLYDWYIYQLDFGGACRDHQEEGFDGGSIIVYKKDKDLPSSYITHFIGIYPLFGEIEWGDASFRKPLFGWKSINLERLRITADAALEIAESQGSGAAFRSQINNMCAISVRLQPNPGMYNGWKIYYWGNYGKKDLYIRVNPIFGNYTSTIMP